MPEIIHSHVDICAAGIPHIAGTRLKVIHIVADHLHWHWDAEALHRQYPQLTLGQIHGALSYYYDHQAEMDRLLDDRQQLEEQLISGLGVSPLQRRLQNLKRAAEQGP